MKKQSQFAIFLLVIGAIAVVVLVAGLFGLQKLSGLSGEARGQYELKLKQYQEINDELEKQPKREELLASLNESLASIDKNLVNYEYIPTYLEQLQKTAVRTGNTILSVRPRPIESLDINNALLKASNEAWQKKYPSKKPANQAAPADAKAKPKAAGAGGKKDKPKSNYRVQQYTLEVEGNYVSLMKFLDALRSFPKLVYVRTISISPRQRTEPDRLTARLETYAIIIPEHYQPAKEQQPVIAAEGGTP